MNPISMNILKKNNNWVVNSTTDEVMWDDSLCEDRSRAGNKKINSQFAFSLLFLFFFKTSNISVWSFVNSIFPFLKNMHFCCKTHICLRSAGRSMQFQWGRQRICRAKFGKFCFSITLTLSTGILQCLSDLQPCPKHPPLTDCSKAHCFLRFCQDQI